MDEMKIPHLETIVKVAKVTVAVAVIGVNTMVPYNPPVNVVRTEPLNGTSKHYQLSEPLRIPRLQNPESEVLSEYKCEEIQSMSIIPTGPQTGDQAEQRSIEMYYCTPNREVPSEYECEETLYMTPTGLQTGDQAAWSIQIRHCVLKIEVPSEYPCEGTPYMSIIPTGSQTGDKAVLSIQMHDCIRK